MAAFGRFLLAARTNALHIRRAMAFYRRIDFARQDWLSRVGGVVAVALGLGLVAAVLILSLGIALVLLPFVAIALIVGRWRCRKMMAEATSRARPSTIEIDYHVVDRRNDGGPEAHRR
jgi:hypothetical protein